MFANLFSDLRDSVRSIRRDAAATVFIIAIAALGVGASTTVFSIVRALVLRPLPFEEPDRLVWIANGTSENLSSQTVQVNNLLEMREGSRAFTDIAAFYAFSSAGSIRLTGAGDPARLTGVPVTESFFPLLGVRPLVGRFFESSEARWNAPKTAVLGHRFWRERFNEDPTVVGRVITLNDDPVTVIGVLPESFDFEATFTPGRRADVFTPFPLSPETNRRGNTLAVIGRLAEGVSLEAAQAEADVVGRRIAAGRVADRNRNAFDPRISTLRARVSGRFQSTLLILAAAVAFLMLLVCANVSNLLLVRASGRRREMAVRAALGASRYRLIRTMIVESVLLFSVASALGVLLAIGGTFAISRVQGTTIPLLNRVEVDLYVLGATVLATFVTGISFGLLPALHASSQVPGTMLGEGSRGSTDRRGGRLRRFIVVTEVALVCVLLTGAGLLSRSLDRVLSVQPGFESDNVFAVRVDSRRLPTLAERSAYFEAIVREVSAVPGALSVGLTDALPLGDNFGWRTWDASPGQGNAPREERVETLVRMIDDGYLGAMHIPLKAGRAFSSRDGAGGEPVIIVNERLARTMWPGQDALGRYLHTSGKSRRVVGVVADVHYFGMDRSTDPEMYMPLVEGDYESVDLVVRGSIPLAGMATGIRSALHRVDPSLPVVEFRTMQQLMDRALFARRFVALLVAGFATFGLLLAALGLYAVISYSVSQRTQELGIRLALGATPGMLRTNILAQTGTLVFMGVLIGLPLSWMAASGIRGMLFGVDSSDPLTFAAVLAILGAVAALAGYVPARRVTHMDPANALRSQ